MGFPPSSETVGNWSLWTFLLPLFVMPPKQSSKDRERKEQSPFAMKKRVKRKAVVFYSSTSPMLGSGPETWRGLREQEECGKHKACTALGLWHFSLSAVRRAETSGSRARRVLPLSLEVRTADRKIPSAKGKAHQSFDIVLKTLLAF